MDKVRVPQSTTAFATTMSETTHTSSSQKVFIGLLMGMVVLGLGSGYVAASALSNKTASVSVPTDTTTGVDQATPEVTVKVGQVFGAKDASSFKDPVEGVLLAGGVGGEGSHHIVRPGGPSQSVYLTSSVVDLKMFEGHKVKISGETFKAQKAGWLMDVGKVEVEQLNAPLPDGATPVPAANQDE